MCGRFTLRSKLNLLLQQFAAEASPDLDYSPRWNVAPTQTTVVVRQRGPGEREAAPLRWGLIPSWSKDAKIGARCLNARGETVAAKPAFRAAFKRRRCLAPVDGWYEWRQTDDGKQPYHFHLPGDRPFALAGLWERWESPDGPLETFTIVTTDSAGVAAQIHDRMPVILAEENYLRWLDPEFADAESLLAMLRPYAGDDLAADPIGTYVNNPRHEGEECLQRVKES